MSKHEVGDKFIVEIDKVFEQDGETLYRAKGMKTLVFDENGLKKLRPYKPEEDEIKVGDEVKNPAGIRGIVIKHDDSFVKMIESNGVTGTYYKEDVTKTGRHIDIASVLAQIGGGENE